MLCQPFSGAGKRLGIEDPRHLFPYVANLAAMFRPPLLLLENVRGHLSLGFDVVLAELDRIGYDVRWTLLRAADVGAPHGRSRLWIAARDRAVGGWPTPPNDPSALAEDGSWVDPASGLFGAIEAQRPGTAGVMVGGRRWDHDAVLAPAGVLFRTDAALLPTPNASISQDGEGFDTWEARRQVALTKGYNGNGIGMPLTIAVQLLPTPVVTDANGTRNRTANRSNPDSTHSVGTTLGDVVYDNSWGPYAAAIARWESITRPAPAPTEQGRSGPRLSPEFVTWMMGLPAGWVTDVPGITRNNALKALGNGVVPQCAAAAYTLLGVADLYAADVAA